MSFFAAQINRTIVAASDHADLKGRDNAFGVIVLAIGGETLDDVSPASQRLRDALTLGVPVIVLADDDCAVKIGQAMELGAAGFIHTGMAKAVFLIAIDLVEAGGVFVPAHTLLSGQRTSDTAEEGRASVDTPEAADEAAVSLQLSRRQFEVLRLLSSGKLNKEIAHELKMTEGTVKAHVRHILRKLSVSNRTQAANLFFKQNGGSDSMH